MVKIQQLSKIIFVIHFVNLDLAKKAQVPTDQINEQIHQDLILNEKALQLEKMLNDKRSLRLAVFNAENQKKDLFLEEWEKNEYGSTVNAIKAYKTLISKDEANNIFFYQKELNIDVLKQIRANFKQQDGIYLQRKFYIDPQQYEKDTKNQQIEQFSDKGSVYFILKDLTSEQKQQLQWHQEDLRTRLNIGNIDPYILTESEEEITDANNFQSIQNVDVLKCNKETTQEQKTEWITKLFNDYEQKLSQILSQQNQNKDQEILENLVQLIMDLERIHPYLDFNCRTFAVFLLNKELLRQNMTPSIMENPNNFDSQTKEELIQQVTIGQENFQNLQNNNKIHSDDPDDNDLILSLEIYKNISYFYCIPTDLMGKQISDEFDMELALDQIKISYKLLQNINQFLEQIKIDQVQQQHDDCNVFIKDLLQENLNRILFEKDKFFILIKKLYGDQIEEIEQFQNHLFQCQTGTKELEIQQVKDRIEKYMDQWFQYNSGNKRILQVQQNIFENDMVIIQLKYLNLILSINFVTKSIIIIQKFFITFLNLYKINETFQNYKISFIIKQFSKLLQFNYKILSESASFNQSKKV